MNATSTLVRSDISVPRLKVNAMNWDDDWRHSDCEDDELIEKACDGCEDAFARLVECNQKSLLRSMSRLLGSDSEAEDAVQVAFIRAFERIRTFGRRSRFSSWLYRIAYNAAIDHRRKHPSQRALNTALEHGV